MNAGQRCGVLLTNAMIKFKFKTQRRHHGSLCGGNQSASQPKKRIMVEFEELDTVNGVKDKNDTGLLELLPLIGRDRVESVVYFFGVTVCTVHLGGRQEVIDRPERVSRENALHVQVGAAKGRS